MQDGVEPEDLPSHIARSWRRSREVYRIDPAAKVPRLTASHDSLGERLEHDYVMDLAAPIFRDLLDHERLPALALAYFDGDGWMTELVGERRIVHRLMDIGYRPGTNWAEASAGTNGPGTALAERSPVEVFAEEHFVEAWQPWTCAAAPILLPGTTTVAGVVDVTGPWDGQHAQELFLATGIARAVEERIRAVLKIREEVVRHALGSARASGDAAAAVDAVGRVLAATGPRCERVARDGLPLEVRRAVASALGSQCPGSDDEIWVEREDCAIVVSPVRYEGAPVGAILRFVGSCWDVREAAPDDPGCGRRSSGPER